MTVNLPTQSQKQRKVVAPLSQKQHPEDTETPRSGDRRAHTRGSHHPWTTTQVHPMGIFLIAETRVPHYQKTPQTESLPCRQAHPHQALGEIWEELPTSDQTLWSLNCTYAVAIMHVLQLPTQKCESQREREESDPLTHPQTGLSADQPPDQRGLLADQHLGLFEDG